MREKQLSLDELQRPIDALHHRLTMLGWVRYKASELIDPTKQWTVRTGYVGGETYVQVNRYSQVRKDLHIASVDPFEKIAYLRLHPAMDDDPGSAVVRIIDQTGMPW